MRVELPCFDMEDLQAMRDPLIKVDRQLTPENA